MAAHRESDSARYSVARPTPSVRAIRAMGTPAAAMVRAVAMRSGVITVGRPGLRTSPASCVEPGDGALTDQVPLELGEGSTDGEQEPAGCCGGVHVACQREGTGSSPRAWDHLGGASSTTVDRVGRQSRAALAVGRSFQDQGVGVSGEPVDG